MGLPTLSTVHPVDVSGSLECRITCPFNHEVYILPSITKDLACPGCESRPIRHEFTAGAGQPNGPYAKCVWCHQRIDHAIVCGEDVRPFHEYPEVMADVAHYLDEFHHPNWKTATLHRMGDMDA